MRTFSHTPDPLKALILERQSFYRKTDSQMAAIIGVSRQTYSNMINNRHTDEWTFWQLKAVLVALNVTRREFEAGLTYERRIGKVNAQVRCGAKERR